MLQASSVPTVKAFSPAICEHCGNGVPRSRSDNFCCEGCATVFGILRTNGFGRYYELKRKFGGEAPSAPVSLPAPDAFQYLDDSEFIASYADASGRRMRFYLEGVHCAACVWLTERLPMLDANVARVQLDLSSGVATVDLGSDGKFSRVAEEFARLGYMPHPVEQREAKAREGRESRRQLLRIGVAAAGAGNIMLFAIGIYAGAGAQYAPLFRGLSFALYLPVLFFSAAPFFSGAYRALKRREVAIDVPIAFGIAAGSLASARGLYLGTDEIYFDSLAGLIFLLLSSRYLLGRVQSAASDATQLLHFLAPSRARRVETDGSIRDVHSESLCAGEQIEVLPGSVCPADGVVVVGSSEVSQAWMTGETARRSVRKGDAVLAGSLNEHSLLRLSVTASGGATRLGEILRQTESALARRAPIALTVDRVARVFVPLTFVLILAGFLVGLRTGLEDGIARAIAVAIVVCPCALAMAVPLAMSRSIGRLAKKGILIRGAETVERLSRVETVWFDKTGTLTVGKLKVIEWYPNRAGLEEILLGLEVNSSHPIALAVQEKFGNAVQPAPVLNLRETFGVGVEGVHEARRYSLRRSETLGFGTEVSLFEDDTQVATLLLDDKIRPGADAAVARLRAGGIQVGILSGDNRAAVAKTSRALSIASTRSLAALSPEGKAAIVAKDSHALFVGDGANDALALAQASVGMAMQGGMEVSLRAAAIYGATNDPRDVPRLIEIARETMRVIHRCLAFTVLYNVTVVVIALSGNLRPLVAAILMPLSAFTILLLTQVGTRRLRALFREESL